MRTFRGMSVIGWKIITCSELGSREELEKKLNGLMDKYEMVDCQYSFASAGHANVYTALVLLAKKPTQNNKVKVRPKPKK